MNEEIIILTHESWERIWEEYILKCRMAGLNAESRSAPNIRQRMDILEKIINNELKKKEKKAGGGELTP